MSKSRTIDRIKEFTGEQKFVFYGSVAMIVSVFMPWYSDLDAFRTGETFLGVTGPLYLAGLLILGLGAVSCAAIFSRSVREKMEHFFSTLGNFYVMAAGFSAFLLLLTNSVYFHPKFGVNISIKETRIGMIICLIGVVALAAGGYFMKKRQSRFHHLDIDSNYEPLVKMPEARDHREVERKHETHHDMHEKREAPSDDAAVTQHTLL